MKALFVSTTTPSASISPYWSFVCILLCLGSALMLAAVQWQFCQLTGSDILFGQGLLQLVLTVILLFIWIKPTRKWQLVGQFFNSFLVLLTCGWLVFESYIHYQEKSPILTSEALPIILLSCGGMFLLSRLLLLIADQEQFPLLGQKVAGFIMPVLSGVLAFVCVLTHVTGWFWLDNLVACCLALTLGVISLFFLLDGYWNILETQAELE